MNKKHIAAVIAAISFASVSMTANAGWSIKSLGTLGGSYSSASDINNLGQIVGTSNLPDKTARAFMTGPNGAGMTALGTLDGNYSSATGINESGQVVGYSYADSSRLFMHPFITGPNGIGITDLGATNQMMIDYPGPNGPFFYEFSVANGINESGQVVGQDGVGYPSGRSDAFMTGPNGAGMVKLSYPEESITVRFPDTSEIEMPSSSFYSGATAINDNGQVVGYLTDPFLFNTHLFITGPNGHGMTFIDGLGDSYSSVDSINNRGEVVGSFSLGGIEYHAFMTGPNGVGITDLGTLGGIHSSASDINESKQVIGSSQTSDGSFHAFLYGDGKMTDLSILPEVLNAGWTDLRANAINDLGQIVGSGKLNGFTQAFLLAPVSAVPEPQTYAMLLVGLGLIGFLGRRRAGK